MKPTYQELEADLAQTKALLRIALEEISKLKERINRNSQNSSKPPSTDQKGNSSGDQSKKKGGREGVARVAFPPERVDNHVPCTLTNCPHCHSTLLHLSQQPPEIIQQAELPEAQAVVTEYMLSKYCCGTCGKGSSGHLPAGIPDSAFGPRLMGLLAALTGVFHLAKREAIQLIKDLYGVDMGVGSVSNVEARVATALEPVYGRIHSFVITCKACKHFDETGWRNSGKRHFVWVASCKDAAVYMIDQTRGAVAFERLLGGQPVGPAVTDRYGVYSRLGKDHQYCLAHLIRDFRRYAERDGPDKDVGKTLEKEFQTVCHIHKRYRQEKLSLGQRNQLLGQRKRRIKHWLEDGMANGTDELSSLCENLLDNFDKMWTFSKIPGMEPTNNLAERDLRKLVIWRKKSYGTRSSRGKTFVERITTVTQSLRRHGRNVLSFIQEVIISFYLKSAPPFLSEAMGF